ncbi:MAG: Glycine--tRNA ligase [Phycisphaerae bacterium]|nr:Glycine--tRNA ligase [Phycisphaerae bacterium]
MPADAAFMDKLVALCKRRGFIFQSSEIYGGIGGFWDYGPLGVELKRNIKNRWWHDHVTNPPTGPDGHEIQMVGLDCSIIMNPKVWEASGHATGFADPMVTCLAETCNKLMRADQVLGLWVRESRSAEFVDVTAADAVLGDARNQATAPLVTSQTTEELLVGLLATKDFKKSTITPTRFGNDPRSAYEIRNRNGRVFAGIIAPITNWAELRKSLPCPACSTIGSLTEPRAFNLMFKTHYGALEVASSMTYLRPETAQGIFCNFKNILDTSRVKIPFGIAQIGKAFRNEVNPRNFIFRSREFEQMEIEFFCREEDSMDWYQFWRNTRYNWYVNLGLKSEKLRLRDQTAEELAHYSKACADIEYLFPFSDEFQELEGCAHRGCFDLTQHEKHSGVDLHYFEETLWSEFLAKRKAAGEPELTKEQKSELGGKPPYRYLPTVIEPSAGADRATLAFLCEAYSEDQKPDAKGVMQTRVYMKFHPKLAPIKAAFLPLVNKEGMPEIAEKLYRDAKKHFNVFFDDGGAIGRRYARQDEAGTPFCITIDGDTLGKEGAANPGTVTIRDRDSLKQDRVGLEHVVGWLKERLGAL